MQRLVFQEWYLSDQESIGPQLVKVTVHPTLEARNKVVDGFWKKGYDGSVNFLRPDMQYIRKLVPNDVMNAIIKENFLLHPDAWKDIKEHLENCESPI